MRFQYLIIISSLFFFFVGTFLIYNSFQTKPYIDETKFNEKYLNLKNGDNENFKNLKNLYKTDKYINLDQGNAIITYSLLLLMFFYFKTNILNLISKINSLIIGIFTVLITFLSEIYVLLRDYERGEYPHWADSLGIPIFSSILLSLVLSIWIFLNYYLNKVSYFKTWFCSLIYITSLFSTIYILEGSFMHICSIFIWILFYQSFIEKINKKENTF